MPSSLNLKFSEASKAFSAGDYATAHHLFSLIVRSAPDNPFALNGLGHSLAMQAGHAKAASLFQKAVQIKPDYLEAIDNLGRAHRELRNYGEAINCFKKILKKLPKNAMVNNQLGLTYLENHNEVKSVSFFNKSVKLNPKIASYHFDLGNAQFVTGQLAEAEISFRNCLNISPDDVQAYSSIASIKKFTSLNDPDIIKMQRLGGEAEISINNKIDVFFALGKAFDDLSEYETAFDYFKQANDLKFSTFTNYDLPKEILKINKIIKVIDQQTINKTSGNPDNSPIFIIGMPRSGTSLVEQILGSHGQVFGAGELLTLPKTIVTMEAAWQIDHPGFLKSKPLNELRQISDVYLKETRSLAGKKHFFTDKLPINSHYIGLIHMLMPQAKIINLCRDPIDVCLSCYTQNFNTHQEFSFNLETLAHYHNMHMDLMTHWEGVLPKGKIYNIHYESLVNEPENEVRKLLTYCGLKWDENCINFHKSKRSVRTASAAQVRSPLHNKSVNRWRNYEKLLAPLLKNLKL